MITIDYLRECAISPPRFCGTGAVKLKTPDGAYRFYNENLAPRNNVEIHSHTNSFRSSILKGVLRHIFYDVIEVEEETQYQLTEGSCKKGCVPQVIAENVKLVETLRTDMAAGTDYVIDSTVFHEIEFVTENIVTLINPFRKGPTPRYVRDKKIGYICPWGDTYISPIEGWEIVDHILKH